MVCQSLVKVAAELNVVVAWLASVAANIRAGQISRSGFWEPATENLLRCGSEKQERRSRPERKVGRLLGRSVEESGLQRETLRNGGSDDFGHHLGMAEESQCAGNICGCSDEET